MSQSLTKNFLYSSILTVSNYLFPLIVFPYVSRVLGVDRIGVCNFVDSIVNYFMLFSMMGISIIGIREIASRKGDKEAMSRAFFSLIELNGFFTFIAAVALLVATHMVPALQPYRELLHVSLFKLIGNFLLIEWFFKGLEDFRYITQRTILVKLVYVAAVFLLVREQSDYFIYYVLTVMMVFVNAIFNIFHARKRLCFDRYRPRVGRYVRPFFFVGSYLLITSMYTSFNVMYLGFSCGDTEVGYYTTSTKLYAIILSLYTAFTGVMIPRMSALIAEGRKEEFRTLIGKSMGILVTLSVPLIMLTVLFAPQIIMLLAGRGYEGAFMPTRIVMPLLFIIGYEQILVIQTMMPAHCDKIVFRNAIVGAMVSLAINLTLVSRLGATGSAIVWLASESTVFLLSQWYVSRHFHIHFPLRQLLRHVVAYLPLVAVLVTIYVGWGQSLVGLLVAAPLTALYFIVIQISYLRNEILMNMLNKIRKKL